MAVFRCRQVSRVALFIGLCLGPSAFAQKPLEPEQKSDEPTNIAMVEVTPVKATARIGEKIQFSAIAKDKDGKVLPDTVKYWYAAPNDAAGSEQNGEVKFFQPGVITIGALIGSKFGYAHVTVSKPHIARIEIAAPSLPLPTGGSHRLVAIPRNENNDPRSDVAITWTSGNKGVATVDSAGLVRAIQPGKARIRATADGVTAEVPVTVVKNLVTTFSITPAASQAKTGDVVRFTAQNKAGAPI